MKTTTCFLTGSLATLAIASAVTLASPSAYAADGPERPCGQPATPAVYLTVVHEPQVRVVPAVTHQAWRWQRDVTTVENEYSKVVTEASTQTVDMTRQVGDTTEYLWSYTEVTQAAVPAVPGTPAVTHVETVVVTPEVTVTEFEYRQKQHPDQTRWEDAGWNGDKGDVDKGLGWEKTGNTRQTVVTPAVTEEVTVVDKAATDGTPAIPELSHVQQTWAATPGDASWTKVQHTVSVPAIVDIVWAQTAPDGYTATGNTHSHTTTETTDVPAADAPAGAGWTKVPESGVVVVDEPQTTEIVGSEWIEQELASPALPATADCRPTVVDVPTTDVAGPKAGGSGAVAGVHVTAHAAAGAGTTSLPNTGNPVSPLLLGTGLGALLAGGALVRIGRRRPTH